MQNQKYYAQAANVTLYALRTTYHVRERTRDLSNNNYNCLA